MTAWVPIGDVELDGGGLIYLEKGHLLGNEQEETFTRKAKETGLTDEEAKSAFNRNMMSTGLLSEGPKEFSERFNRRWLVSEFEAGDVVLHNPFAIHASTLNYHKNNVIRLATDLRFVDSSRPWDTVSISESQCLEEEANSLSRDGRSNTPWMMVSDRILYIRWRVAFVLRDCLGVHSCRFTTAHSCILILRYQEGGSFIL